MAAGGETKDAATGSEPKCCGVSPDRRHPGCWPIDIPDNDPFYGLFRRKCLEFVRSATGLKDSCRLGSRSTFNQVSSVLDASFVYGNDEETASRLRTFRGGLLKTNPVFGGRLKDLLPPKLDNPDEGCMRPSRDVHCFIAGNMVILNVKFRSHSSVIRLYVSFALLFSGLFLAPFLSSHSGHWPPALEDREISNLSPFLFTWCYPPFFSQFWRRKRLSPQGKPIFPVPSVFT